MKIGRVYFLSPCKTSVLSDMVDLDTFCWSSGDYTENKLHALKEAKSYLERKLQIVKNEIVAEIESMEFCPDCHSKLKAVRRPANSVLNQEQFDSVKAGDYFCPKCTDKTTRSGFRYFWKMDLNIPEE